MSNVKYHITLSADEYMAFRRMNVPKLSTALERAIVEIPPAACGIEQLGDAHIKKLVDKDLLPYVMYYNLDLDAWGHTEIFKRMMTVDDSVSLAGVLMRATESIKKLQASIAIESGWSNLELVTPMVCFGRYTSNSHILCTQDTMERPDSKKQVVVAGAIICRNITTGKLLKIKPNWTSISGQLPMFVALRDGMWLFAETIARTSKLRRQLIQDQVARAR